MQFHFITVLKCRLTKKPKPNRGPSLDSKSSGPIPPRVVGWAFCGFFGFLSPSHDEKEKYQNSDLTGECDVLEL